MVGKLPLAALAVVMAISVTSEDVSAQSSHKVSVTYTDLTGTQPMSSSAFVSHGDDFHLWTEGKPAEVTIRRIAEEGNPEWILGMAVFDRNHRFLDEAVALPALPRQTRTLTVTVDAAHPRISGAWMLGMTNDGFVGIDAVDAYHLTQPTTIEVFALDAGTRQNSEKKEHTAALGGLVEDPEGGVVARHPGIRGDSDIPVSFMFDPAKSVARVTIAPIGNWPAE